LEEGLYIVEFLSGELLPLLLALVSGVFMAVQGTWNSALGKVIGLLEATFIVHLSGTIFLIVLLFVFRVGKGDFSAWQNVPWYAYLGGIAGVIIVYLVVASIPQVGVANATTAIIIGQVATAVLIDHLGGFGVLQVDFGWNQAIGLLLLAIGAKLMLL
jgi:bacterial/archaeal transporter family-2 protein